MKKLLRIIAAALCLALLAGTALAEGFVNLGGEGYDCLYYKCSLPDGRFLLAGSKAEPGHYSDRHKARLLCMNPNGTVSWEYIDPEGQCAMFGQAVVSTDGMICVVYDDSPYQDTVAMSMKFFTLDGQPAGEAVPMDFSFGLEYWLTPQGLLTESYNWSANRREYMEFTAWNGRTLFRRRGGLHIVFDPGTGVIAEEDGLVLYGRESASEGTAAKIMKVDYDGNTVWENVLPQEMDLGRASIQACSRTQDGRYIGWVVESSGDNYTYWTVTLSAEGRELSREETGMDNNDSIKAVNIDMMTECQGKYVTMEMDGDGVALERTYRFLWYDAEGKELGTTEVQIRKEDFPQFKNGKDVCSFSGALIPAGDCLWQLFDIWDETDDFEKTQGSYEEYMFRVPMP